MNREVYDRVLSVLSADRPAVIVSIARTTGSTPRKEGSCMFVSEDGSVCGTIGGGALEKYCAEEASGIYAARKGCTRDFNLSGNAPFSMICGGDVTVEFKYFGGRGDLKPAGCYLSAGSEKPAVYIFGAGHVGSALCPVLASVGFSVYMVDDRPEFAAKDRNPSAVDCILCDYDDISSLPMKEDDYAVVMTHGHIADRQVLLQVCRTQKKYIGCIGSKKKVETTAAFLRENGIGEDRISSVRSPIGLPIGGESPEEISISVAAEILQYYWKAV